MGDICGPPVMDAVRCEDAAIAAAEGSKEEVSTNDLPSWMVGDGFFVYVKGLASDGARGVTIIEPLFDAGTVECLSRANGNGIKHKLKRDRTKKVGRDGDLEMEKHVTRRKV